MQVRVFDQPSDVGVAAGDIIKELLKETIKSSNRVTIGLSVEDAASSYQDHLLSFFGPSNGYPCFDLLLLGMGPDGHTCSLFPNHSLLYAEDFAVASITDSPKLPLKRVTLTIPVINKAKKVVFMVCGQDKALVVKSTLECDHPGPSLPCTLIHPVDGPLIWLLDKNAASQLTNLTKTI